MYHNVTMMCFCVAIFASEKQQCLLLNVELQVVIIFFEESRHNLGLHTTRSVYYAVK